MRLEPDLPSLQKSLGLLQFWTWLGPISWSQQPLLGSQAQLTFLWERPDKHPLLQEVPTGTTHHWLQSTAVHHPAPLLCFSLEVSGVTSSHWVSAGSKTPSHAVIPGSGRKHWLPLPYPTLKFLSLHSMWASVLTLGPSWVTGTWFYSLSFAHVAIFQGLNIKSWRNSAAHHPTIFPEVLMLSLTLKQSVFLCVLCPRRT